jgi:NAD+ synthase (glutamine-hydrolysing)
MKLRVALAQINPTVGDLAGNAALISKYAKEAHAPLLMSLFFQRWF